MMKHFLCAALLLAACDAAMGRELKTETLAKADAFASVGDNVATAQQKVAMATGGQKPVVPPSACDNTRSPSNIVKSGSMFKATLSGTKNINPNTTGAPGQHHVMRCSFPACPHQQSTPGCQHRCKLLPVAASCCQYSATAHAEFCRAQP
jgi:hypothetical protein